MKKLFLCFLYILLTQSFCFAKDLIQFDFPNEGWHQVASPDGISSKKCFVPYNQTSQNYTEMVIFFEKVLKNHDISPVAMLHRQLGKDRNNYYDISTSYVIKDIDNAMITWCSQARNTCSVERAFLGKQGVLFAIYINKSPHYSQNMFGQWTNILNQAKLYEPVAVNEKRPNNVIELD